MFPEYLVTGLMSGAFVNAVVKVMILTHEMLPIGILQLLEPSSHRPYDRKTPSQAFWLTVLGAETDMNAVTPSKATATSRTIRIIA